jgi:hypothetical protein
LSTIVISHCCHLNQHQQQQQQHCHRHLSPPQLNVKACCIETVCCHGVFNEMKSVRKLHLCVCVCVLCIIMCVYVYSFLWCCFTELKAVLIHNYM